MKRSNALKRMLEDHTPLYAGDRVPVRFAKQPHFAGPSHGGPYLAVNPDVSGWYDVDVSGPNELRLLRDTLSHEAYEYRLGAPSAKEPFMRRHGTFHGSDEYEVPGPKAKAAGAVYNILRDAWVNTTRCRDFPGLRRTFALKADLLAGDTDISELPPGQAAISGLHQISLTNTANGIRDADDDVRSLLATARRYVEATRTAKSHDELVALAHGLFEKFAPLFEDVDEELEDSLDDLAALHPDTQTGDMTDEDLQDAIENGNATVADDPDEADATVTVPEDADGEDGEATEGVTADTDESGEDAASDAADNSEGDTTDDASDGASGHSRGESEDSLLADMDALDGMDRRAGSVMDLDDTDDYHEPDEGDEARYERIQRAEAFDTTDIADRMNHRDNYNRKKSGDLSADEIQELMRESGLAADLRRAFQKIKTAEVSKPTSRATSNLHLGNVVRHMAGDYGVRDVYESTKRGATGGRTIAGVIDASGSMNSSGSIGVEYGGDGAIVDAKVVLAALHIATTEIGDDLVATAFDSGNEDDVRLVTGPDESFEWDHLDGFTAASGYTSTAAGVMDGIRLLNRGGGKERVMLVVTDGGANQELADTRWESYTTGDTATDDARKAVELAREEGIRVIGIGVGTGINDSKLERTFGLDGWIHVESGELVDEVVRIYREQLDDDRIADVGL